MALAEYLMKCCVCEAEALLAQPRFFDFLDDPPGEHGFGIDGWNRVDALARHVKVGSDCRA